MSKQKSGEEVDYDGGEKKKKKARTDLAGKLPLRRVHVERLGPERRCGPQLVVREGLPHGERRAGQRRRLGVGRGAHPGDVEADILL